tara:strand:+ start:1527 stop:1937 length:411 start_codon:yes stop_codon:yes gene_type:complete
MKYLITLILVGIFSAPMTAQRLHGSEAHKAKAVHNTATPQPRFNRESTPKKEESGCKCKCHQKKSPSSKSAGSRHSGRPVSQRRGGEGRSHSRREHKVSSSRKHQSQAQSQAQTKARAEWMNKLQDMRKKWLQHKK